MSKLTVLQEQLKESNDANRALIENMAILTDQYEAIKELYNKELEKIRIPNKLTPYQYNEISAHLTKLRPDFLKVLEAPEPLELTNE